MSAQIASIATNSLSQMGSDDEDILCKRKTKRGILPKTATKIMKSWLFQHIVVSIIKKKKRGKIPTYYNSASSLVCMLCPANTL